MADLFHEVDEQLRSARLQSTVRKGWPYAAGLVAVAGIIALAAWALNQREQAQDAAASIRYAAATGALQRGDTKTADAGFGALAQSGPRAYRTLALMQEAGIRLKAGDAAAATGLLDQAAQAAPNVIMADAARLEAAYIVMDGGDYMAIRGRLVPLEATGRPFRMMAQEALGLTELAYGRIPEARGDLQVVSLSSDVSDAARGRASAALDLIRSGDWTSIAPLAKASATLKPQPPPAQTLPGQPGAVQPGAQPAAGGAAAQPTADSSAASAPPAGAAQ